MATRKKKDAAATPAKVSKAATLRDKDVAGLQTEIKDLQKAHFGLRMQKATQQLSNTVDAARHAPRHRARQDHSCAEAARNPSRQVRSEHDGS